MTKVAVTGTTHCGKTMFLTSLLWQLEEFDETRFRLREGVMLRGFHPARVHKGEDAFPFKRFRNMLAQEYRWPEKTRDVYHYRCAFHRSDRWRIRGPQSLDFLDLPGERIADAAMVVHEDYGAWSDDLLDHLGQDPVGREVAAEFRDTAKPGAGARDVVLAYRLALARLIRAWKPLVSPSVFLLDRAGTLARDVDEAELVASRRCGLDDAREFAPLPREVRKATPELSGEMRRHYREYRKKIVLPLFRDLMTASSLVVLVDIPSLLLAGDRRFVDERQVTLDLLGAMRGGALGDRILRALGLRNSLKRVAFVAAKADLVSPDDLRNGRLLALLKSMNARAAQRLSPAVEVKWFVCSACVSTQPGSAPHTLIGQTQPGPYTRDRQAAEFCVSPLPEEWPRSWKGGDFEYPSFWPRVPENTMIPPRHRNLDAVFDFTALG
ncbi:MAG: YcjX family protein [Acidobacteriota bacterium]|nr:YcjX family protein [Acidobacteriota bacterium]